ncbi:MAG: hypothetical protein FJZ38_15025 [Candidatus Rokubacteria bacterium]|nr:hypothetical protein [Candidatus Rokubacteria bacterium]
MDDTALLSQERWEIRQDHGASMVALGILLRVSVMGIGALILLYAFVAGRFGAFLAAVVLLVLGWYLGNLGKIGPSATILDRKRREVVTWSTYDGKRKSETFSLPSAERMAVRRTTTGVVRGRPVATYHVWIAREDGDVLVSSEGSADAARELAQKVGVFLGLPFDGLVERG